VIVEIAAPTAYHVRTIDEKYFIMIKQALEKITQKKCDVALIVVEPKKEEKKSTASTKMERSEPNMNLFASPEPDKQVGNNLNPRYQFDNYVVGSSNRLAFAAGKAVVDFPGTRHNPLFIYGGVGVGKTHLMHAVGHELVKKGVGKVVYVTSEQFTNDLVSSLRSKMTDAFKKKYRQVGALLIDRKPQDIEGLEDRLKSRFLGGMAVDIGLPDYEMRLAILRQKAQEIKVEVEDGAYELMANNFNTNARELEGTFVKLAVGASLEAGILTKEMVQQTMGLPAIFVKEIKVRPIKVISTVAKYFDYRNKDLLGTSRKADLVVARHIAMFLLRDTLGIQLEKVGEIMGGRDHTTVMHAVEKMKNEVSQNGDIRRKVTAIKQALYT
jgi:chromosomal replication initiator protein